MRFIRKGDYDEVRLKQEFSEEFEFSCKALEVKNMLNLSREAMGNADLSNLYHITRRYEYIFFSNLINERAKSESDLDVLDVGCGTSYAPFSFSKQTNRYVGIDLYDLKDFYSGLSERVEFIQHDITKTSLDDASFDLVVCISVLEHIPKALRLKAFDNIYASLKSNGSFSFTFDVDLEGNGAGFSFDEVAETIFYLKNLGFESSDEIDLTTYDDLVTTEPYVGLPQNRYQLPWRISKEEPSLINRVLQRLGLKSNRYSSLAVVRGSFRKV